MKKTCGIFIFDRDGLLLLCHPTNAPFVGKFWSIPKGEQDFGETDVQTALRETFEESSISLSPAQVSYVGEMLYKSGKKTLHAYVVKLSEGAATINVKCTSSFIDKDDQEVIEVDVFKWVTPDVAASLLHEAQEALLPKAVKMIS